MFDIGWQEFILIALVAVVVVGPKDLPRVIRAVGQWVRKARSLASEFQGSLEEMAREAELDDVRKQIQQVSREGVGASIEKHVDPDGTIRRSVEEARDSSGADEISEAFDEARRDTEAAATRARSDMAAAEIPDNSVKPPEEPVAAKAEPASAASTASAGRAGGAKAAAKSSGSKSPGAKSAGTKSAGTKSPAAKGNSAKGHSAKGNSAKPAGRPGPAEAPKPKRPARKPAISDAGEA